MLYIKDCVLASPDQWKIIIKGMRNAFESWDKSDSIIETVGHYYDEDFDDYNYINGDYLDYDEGKYLNPESFLYDNDYINVSQDIAYTFYLGPKDKNLLLNLSKLGSSDRKVLRQLPITLEIKAPLKWWDQMDQYKIGTVTNSTSQMHCVMNKPFTFDDFAFDETRVAGSDVRNQVKNYVDMLNTLRNCYINEDSENDKKSCWRILIECLPQSYYYTRTWTGSYENIINIILQRYNHKLNEWRVFCRYCLDCIPMVREIIETIKPEIIEIYYGEESC